ncbi:MAG: ABC transporter substrate-binding protein [Acidimicrobiales bacterium]
MTTDHRRTRWRVLVLLIAVLGALALASCGSDGSDGGSGSSDGGSADGGGKDVTIRISSQDFSEQKTLAQVYGQYLEAQGFDVDIQEPIGTRDQIFAALESGDLDLQLDYTGFALSDGLDAESPTDADEAHDALVSALADKDLEAAEQSEATDANALVALPDWADENDVTTISDLANVDGTITLGGSAECAERDDCLVGYQDTYGLDLEFKAVDYGPPLVAALKAGEIQVAQYGTTAPEISTGDVVALEDDKGLQLPGNVVPIFRAEVSSDALIEALNTISAALTTDDLAAWNQATDVDKEDPVDVATQWLQDNDLI